MVLYRSLVGSTGAVEIGAAVLPVAKTFDREFE
jgi:hypothetical protein